MTVTHAPTIIETESITLDDGRLLYRARCSCRWFGWAVFDRDNAVRQRDRHLAQAEVDHQADEVPVRREETT